MKMDTSIDKIRARPRQIKPFQPVCSGRSFCFIVLLFYCCVVPLRWLSFWVCSPVSLTFIYSRCLHYYVSLSFIFSFHFHFTSFYRFSRARFFTHTFIMYYSRYVNRLQIFCFFQFIMASWLALSQTKCNQNSSYSCVCFEEMFMLRFDF